MTAAAKKKPKAVVRKRVPEKKLWEHMEKVMVEFTKASERRYAKAMKVYDAQDAITQDALDRMVDHLCAIARKKMYVGTQTDRVVAAIPDQVVKNNMTYMAVEILIDLAQMDIQIEGFKMPKLCAVCKDEIKPRKKGK